MAAGSATTYCRVPHSLAARGTLRTRFIPVKSRSRCRLPTSCARGGRRSRPGSLILVAVGPGSTARPSTSLTNSLPQGGRLPHRAGSRTGAGCPSDRRRDRDTNATVVPQPSSPTAPNTRPTRKPPLPSPCGLGAGPGSPSTTSPPTTSPVLASTRPRGGSGKVERLATHPGRRSPLPPPRQLRSRPGDSDHGRGHPRQLRPASQRGRESATVESLTVVERGSPRDEAATA